MITDSGERQLWLAATARDNAIDAVLDAVPEGWTAGLVQQELGADVAAALNMQPGEVRRHKVS
ncbi:hypothetical protein CO683_03785 [Bradyrhizobium ottawaense]|nr:hypothetical protein CO683_03785 [Bradyrhizobium ottawaense]